MTLRIFRLISRYFLGSIFIFSGFVKAIDPLGSTYKFTDYFEAFGWEALRPIALILAILLSSSELLIGLCLVFKLRMKVTAWALLIFISFFTILTLYIAIKNPVTDCGCFGDALILSNWQTFYKNLVFFIPTVIIFWQRKKFEIEFNVLYEWALTIGLFLTAVFISVYCYRNLPLIDFRPYKLGTNIPASMIVPKGMQRDEYKTVLVYEKTGIKKEFDLNNAPYSDTTWKWIETKNTLIKKGYEPPIHDFSITSTEGEDMTKSILSDPGYSFLIVSYKLENASRKGLEDLNSFALMASANGYSVYGMTASTIQTIDSSKLWLKPVFNFYTTDEITLKTMIRSNPGLMLIKEGNVIGKWSYRNIPQDDFFKSNGISYSLLRLYSKSTDRLSLIIVLLVGFSALILFVLRRKYKNNNNEVKSTKDKPYNFDSIHFDSMRKDPTNYYLGIFYFNKKDQRIFLPKRNPGFGWTVNFARPQVYLVFGLIIIISIVVKLIA